MTRDLTSTNTKNLPPMYKLLAEFIANETSPKLHEYIFQLHSNSTSKLTKQAKIVPEIVYQVSKLYLLATTLPITILSTVQMEQLDVVLLKLMSCILDKPSVRRLIVRSSARDFKLGDGQMRRAEEETAGVAKRARTSISDR